VSFKIITRKSIQLFIKREKDVPYSRSLRFGLRDGSLDKNPKINKETKNITTAYTKIFKVNIRKFLKISNL